MVRNGLSVDVDDFSSAFGDAYNVKFANPHKNDIPKEIVHTLKLLKGLGVFATFFINGKSVAASPDVIKQIADAGHEIGCHGYSHKFMQQYKTQQEFEEDLEKCLDLICTHTKIRPIGYRAPGCSIFLKKDMVLDALKKYGFVYDSSITTFGVPKQHGHGVTPVDPFKWENGIMELPLSSARLSFFKVPAFGSYFLRLFPAFLTDSAMSNLNRVNKNVFFYFHPFELIRNKYPREIMNINFPFVYIYTLFSGSSFQNKLSYILKKYQFEPYGELVKHFSGISIADNLA